MSESSEVMRIKTKIEWEAIIAQGAEILLETGQLKIFRTPDGKTWRSIHRYRMAWPVTVIAGEKAIREIDIEELI